MRDNRSHFEIDSSVGEGGVIIITISKHEEKKKKEEICLAVYIYAHTQSATTEIDED
jgi:hypothetical protein